MGLRFFGIDPPDSKHTPCLITPFTGIHFLSGVIVNMVFRRMNIKYTPAFIIWFIIHMIYELKDLHGSYIKNFDNYYQNHSVSNSIADQIFAVAGFMIGQNIPLKFFVPFLTFYIVIVITAYKIKAA
jgi:nucleoside recognition membrane protein YjiH